MCGLFDQYIYGRIENPGNGRAEYTSEELNQLPAKDDLDLGRVSRELSFYSLLHRKDVSEVSRSYFPVPFLVIKRAASYAIAMQLLDGKKQNNQSRFLPFPPSVPPSLRPFLPSLPLTHG